MTTQTRHRHKTQTHTHSSETHHASVSKLNSKKSLIRWFPSKPASTKKEFPCTTPVCLSRGEGPVPVAGTFVHVPVDILNS